MNHTQDMDYADFVDTATDLVNGLMPRIPERWRKLLAMYVEEQDGIQEPRFFMEDLIAVLDGDQVPITPTERDTVVRLMKHRKMDPMPVERFNVTDTAPSQEPSAERPDV